MAHKHGWCQQLSLLLCYALWRLGEEHIVLVSIWICWILKFMPKFWSVWNLQDDDSDDDEKKHRHHHHHHHGRHDDEWSKCWLPCEWDSCHRLLLNKRVEACLPCVVLLDPADEFPYKLCACVCAVRSLCSYVLPVFVLLNKIRKLLCWFVLICSVYRITCVVNWIVFVWKVEGFACRRFWSWPYCNLQDSKNLNHGIYG